MKTILTAIVKGYQSVVSPYLGPRCRFIPSCSSYMREAIEKWGAVKGGWMGVRRFLRCHPWGSSGWDPVPSKEYRTSVFSFSDINLN